jgi:HAD superfamily hydrolase (TIGR01509 family)
LLDCAAAIGQDQAMTLPRPPAAVIFDMDGLIFDTESLHRDAFMAAAVEHGHDLSLDFFLSLVGRPWDQNRRALEARLGSAEAVEHFRLAWVEGFERLATTSLRVKAGVTELLDLLDSLDLPRAIATSSAHSAVRHHLAACGLEGRFDAVVAHGDYAAGKPAPDPFLRAAEALGAAPEDCLALEDSHNGVRAAAAAGMMVVMVPDLLPPTEALRPLCTAVAHSLHDVCAWMATEPA